MHYGEWPDFNIDHENRNGEDNGIRNLRHADQSDNMGNSRKHVSGTSKYKGVHRHSVNDSWTAAIRRGDTRYHLGSFKSEEEAAMAYDAAATRLFGEFARINFP